MALMKCPECGGDVSTTAKACPHCGSTVKKPTSRAAKLVFVAVGVCVVAGIVAQQQADEARAARSPEQVRADDQAVARLALARVAVKTVKQNLRNPDSVKWESVRINQVGDVACLEYRAQNGFGGMSKEFVVFVSGTASQSEEVWNKRCTKGLFDLTSMAT
jgi:predicted  nucleic acid-binding Zn-ribbon protein